MKKIFLVILFLISISIYAHAQSTATQTVMGFLSTTCPGSQFVCFIPYSISNPFPVVSN